MVYRKGRSESASQAVTVHTDAGGPSLGVGAAVLVTWLGVLAVGLEMAGGAAVQPGALAVTALSGIVVAALAAYSVGRSAAHTLGLRGRTVIADDEPVLDLDEPLDACVVQNGDDVALIAAQAATRLVLHGRIGDALGGSRLWRARWHRARTDHLGHVARDLAPGATWSTLWRLGESGATLSCRVEASQELSALGNAIREAAAAHGGALLVLPTAHPAHPVLRIRPDGVLEAFGETLDTRRAFDRTYVWTHGRENDRSDADALILRQDEDRAVRLSVTRTPGRWPAHDALPGLRLDVPGPEVPAEELLSPVGFGAVEAALDAAGAPRAAS